MYVADFKETTIRILEEYKFIPEARMRELIYHEGSYHDCFVYGLLAEEWRMEREEEEQA
jgi:RimJ/RimL family protein N-acetyltransferase